MSARILLHPEADPEDVWPGVLSVNDAGRALAVEMFVELTGTFNDDDGDTIAYRSGLENWERGGRQFRNVVSEYLARAAAAGPDVTEGFCATLSDFVAHCCQGVVPSVEFYEKLPAAIA